LQKKKKVSRTVVGPRTRRKRRTADDILNRIVVAATAEFKRTGFAGTSTATIARKADVTEAQLFRYFGSKSTLFRETIFKPINQHFLAFIEQHVPDIRQTTSSELARIYTSELQKFITAHADTLTSLVAAQTYDNGASHGVGKIDSLSTYFERGAANMAARIKGKPKVDPRLLVRVAFVSVLGSVLFKEWIFSAGLATDKEIEAAINQFVLEGIGANSRRD
jgi:AcrR family transcriptional regulator